MWFLALAGAILVAAVAVVLTTAFRGGGDGGAATGVDGPCARQTFPPMGRQHVEALRSGFQYNSFPPTSGPHFGVPAVYNIYDQPVPELRVVHNLEHGAIVVQYGSKVPPQMVQQIAGWYSKDPLGLIVAPLPAVTEIKAKPPAGYENKIFLTAWTHVATCTAFDEGAFDRFRDDFRGHGPEQFPVSALQPGGT